MGEKSASRMSEEHSGHEENGSPTPTIHRPRGFPADSGDKLAEKDVAAS